MLHKITLQLAQLTKTVQETKKMVMLQYKLEQKTHPKYGILRTPYLFLLDQEPKIQFIAVIDYNSKSLKEVKIKYVEDAFKTLQAGKKTNYNFNQSLRLCCKS